MIPIFLLEHALTVSLGRAGSNCLVQHAFVQCCWHAYAGHMATCCIASLFIGWMTAQEVQDKEMQLLLQELSLIMTPVIGGMNATPDQARGWTLQQWVTDLFPVSHLLYSIFLFVHSAGMCWTKTLGLPSHATDKLEGSCHQFLQ